MEGSYGFVYFGFAMLSKPVAITKLKSWNKDKTRIKEKVILIELNKKNIFP